MKKKVILSIIMGIMALSLISCGKSGKISNRKFEKILDAYQLYFEEEYEEEYDDECGAKIIIHTDGMPMMLAFGYEDDKDGEAALFTYQDGEVKCLEEFDKEMVVIAYSDGIVSERDFYDDDEPMNLYVIEEELEEIGCIDNQGEEVVIKYRDEKLKLESPANEEDYKEFVDGVYKLIYGEEMKPDSIMYHYNIFDMIYDEQNFYRSIPLAYTDDDGLLEADDFEDQIDALKEAGSMTQEEFILWNLHFGAELDQEQHTRNSLEGLFLRDVTLFNEVDEDVLEDYEEELLTILLYRAVDYDMPNVIETVNFVSETSDKEIKEILLERFCSLDLPLCLKYDGEMPEFVIEANTDKEGEYVSAKEEAEAEVIGEFLIDFKVDAKALAKAYIEETAIAGSEEILDDKEGGEILEAYCNLLENLPNQVETWQENYENSERKYVDAYKKFVENYDKSADTEYHYALCRAGKDGHICLKMYMDYTVEGETVLYVYDGDKYFYEYSLAGGRWYAIWAEEINGWYTTGSGGAAAGHQGLITVEDGRIKALFSGYWDAWNDLELEIYEDGKSHFVSLTEYNRMAMELFGKPFLEYDGGPITLLEETLERKDEPQFTGFFDTVEEAYDAFRGMEEK